MKTIEELRTDVEHAERRLQLAQTVNVEGLTLEGIEKAKAHLKNCERDLSVCRAKLAAANGESSSWG